MDATILVFLIQDGLTKGAVYALIGLALVLVFAVTRVIFIPQGEFVAYGALTLATFDAGLVPGTAALAFFAGVLAFVFETWSRRHSLTATRSLRDLACYVLLPAAVWWAASVIVPLQPGVAVKILLTLGIIVPLGPYLYRIAFQPLANASVLVLLIAAVGVHLSMTGLGLFFFGAEGLRAQPISRASFSIGQLTVSGQSIAIYVAAVAVMLGLYLFIDRTLLGKALRATAINRLGAELVGIRTTLSGSLAFALAAFIGSLCGILIAPITTIYYDTGFTIGLKGFVAAIIAGLVSFPIAIVGALFVGAVESFASFFASNFKEIILFAMLIPVLIWRSLVVPDSDEGED
jgi:branched-chain amino acid transport system permease protein